MLLILFIWGSLVSCSGIKTIPLEDDGKPESECVILLHGMGRTKSSMDEIEEGLSKGGYNVVNFDYPSRKETIEQIAENWIPKAIAQCPKSAEKVHFVTHSLGGIITRKYLQTNKLPSGSRIVMLSPPNQGSEVADYFKDTFWYRWFTGPVGQQLTTDSDSVPNQLAPIAYEVGVITGTRSFDPWFSILIPGTDDGKVSVERAKLAEMKDFLTVPHTHTFIMNSDEVLRQIKCFLKKGYFDHTGR